MAGTYKRPFLIDFGTFRCLSKYFLEREDNEILERCSKNMYAIENKDVNLYFLKNS